MLSNHFYTLVYSNLASVSDDIVAEAVVRRGQPLGVAGLVTASLSGTPITYQWSIFKWTTSSITGNSQPERGRHRNLPDR